MPPPERIWLKRSGARPLTFEGWLLLEATNWSPELDWWHEVRIYETDAGAFAVAIGAFFKTVERADFWRAHLVEEAEAAARVLRTFDPAADVPSRLDLLDPSWTEAGLDAACRAIGDQVERTRTAYRRMLETMLPS